MLDTSGKVPDKPFEEYVHNIKIDKNSKFYEIVNTSEESLYKKDEKMNAIFKEFISACKKIKLYKD